MMWPIADLHGVNTRWDLAQCEQEKRKRINMAHALNGVSFIDPENCYIENDVQLQKTLRLVLALS
ncbi:MAG: hypothetical protein IPJ88_01175 [Myxococcales bacterium]|nr:MAG: hypothetical protein IPJ88_01175 [Myxococcales bacterium]